MKIADTKSMWFSVMFCFISWSLSAQLLGSQDLLLQPSELLLADPAASGNAAYINQVGSSNDVELYQDQHSASTGNMARIFQSGDWNIAVITQSGHGNQLALIQQGDLNILELLSEGYGNESTIVQSGNGNYMLQKLIDSNGIKSELVQIGNNNEITTILEGIQEKNYAIRQIGDGLKVIIRQSSF